MSTPEALPFRASCSSESNSMISLTLTSFFVDASCKRVRMAFLGAFLLLWALIFSSLQYSSAAADRAFTNLNDSGSGAPVNRTFK